jgi:peptidoglycan/LPS O-acetylase OafA/YrhL
MAVQDRSAYFHNHQTYTYLAIMFSKDMESADRLPGVFAHNPQAFRIDGPLWTIRYELFCYLMVAIFGVLGLIKRRSAVLFILGVFWCLLVFGLYKPELFGRAETLFRLGSYFFAGSLFYLSREKIRYSGWAALACASLVVITDLTTTLDVFEPFLLAYLIFYFAYNKSLKFNEFARFGDFSYGLYLYAFPVQQLLTLYLLPRLNAYSLFACAFPITLAIAIISWKCVEEPFLRLKPKRAPRSAASIPGGEELQMRVAA